MIIEQLEEVNEDELGKINKIIKYTPNISLYSLQIMNMPNMWDYVLEYVSILETETITNFNQIHLNKHILANEKA